MQRILCPSDEFQQCSCVGHVRLGDWDAMAESERKRVVDDLVHEDRAYH